MKICTNPILTQAKPSGLAILLTAALAVISACSVTPKAPDWQMEVKGSMDRSVSAYLEGNDSVAKAELARSRSQLSSTGRADLVATAELMHCAARTASLVFEPCEAFEALRQDATPDQVAYANYLRGQTVATAVPLLPESQRIAAMRSADEGGALTGIDEPLSLLVAAGFLFKTGRASPAVLEQAVNTASRQGWRRPLLAWLGVQSERALLAGQMETVARLRRRMDLVQGISASAR